MFRFQHKSLKESLFPFVLYQISTSIDFDFRVVKEL